MASRSSDIHVGDLIKITEGKNEGQRGTVRYVGALDGQEGIFVGVELKEKKGRHNGTVKGRQYFDCPDGYGYMGKAHMFKVVVKGRRSSTASSSSSGPRPRKGSMNREQSPTRERNGASRLSDDEDPIPPIPESPREDGTDDVSFNHTTPDSDVKATEAATEEKEANHDENSTHNSESVQNGDTKVIPRPIKIPRTEPPRNTGSGSNTPNEKKSKTKGDKPHRRVQSSALTKTRDSKPARPTKPTKKPRRGSVSERRGSVSERRGSVSERRGSVSKRRDISTSTSGSSSRNASPEPPPKKGKASARGTKNRKEKREKPAARLAPPSLPPATPQPKIITTDDKAIQTEAISVAEFSQTVADTQRLEIEAIREQLRLSQARVHERDEQIIMLQEKVMSLEESVEMLVLEKGDMEEELATLRDTVEDWEIKHEHAMIDIDELKEDRANIRQNLLNSLDIEAQETAEILESNKELQETLDSLQRVMVDALQSKMLEIEDLNRKLTQMPILEQKITELQEKEQKLNRMIMENEELKAELDIRSDVEGIIQHLTNKNLTLEAEIDEIRDEMQHLRDLNEIQQAVNTETDAYVDELHEELHERRIELDTTKKDLEKHKRELTNLQKQMHKFRNHVRDLESNKKRMLTMQSGLSASRHEERMRAEALMHENVNLRGAIGGIREIVINHGRLVATSYGDRIRAMLVQQHFPHTIPVDFDSIEFLAQLERMRRKAKFCREMLDRFYVDTLTQGIGYSSSDTDIIEKAHGMCPILFRHERWAECIQRRCCLLYLDVFDQVVKFRMHFEQIEPVYDRLLDACASDNLHTFAVRDLGQVSDIFRSFFKRHCSSDDLSEEFSPEKEMPSDSCMDKWSLREGTLDIYYTCKTFSARFLNTNNIIHNLIDTDNSVSRGRSGSTGTPGGAVFPHMVRQRSLSSTSDQPMIPEEKQEEDPERATADEMTTPQEERILQVGVIEKIHSLEESISEMFHDILGFAVPIAVEYRGKKSLLKFLSTRNKTNVQYGAISECLRLARLVVIKVGTLRNDLESISRADAVSVRIDHINKIFDRHSEINEEGLICSLETLFRAVKDVQLIVNVDAEREKENSQFAGEVTDNDKKQAKPVWFVKADMVKDKLEGAEQVYDDLEMAKNDVKVAKKEIWEIQRLDRETQAKNKILGQEITKLKQQHDDFARLEKLLQENQETMTRYRKERDSLREKYARKEKETEDLMRDLDKHKTNLQELRAKRHDDEEGPTMPTYGRRRSESVGSPLRRTGSSSSVMMTPHLRSRSTLQGVQNMSPTQMIRKLSDPSGGSSLMMTSPTSTSEMQYRNAIEEHQEQIGILTKTVNSLRSQLTRMKLNAKCDDAHLKMFMMPNNSLYRRTPHHPNYGPLGLNSSQLSVMTLQSIEEEDSKERGLGDGNESVASTFSHESFDASEEEFLHDILSMDNVIPRGDEDSRRDFTNRFRSDDSVRDAARRLVSMNKKIGLMRANPKIIDLSRRDGRRSGQSDGRLLKMRQMLEEFEKKKRIVVDAALESKEFWNDAKKGHTQMNEFSQKIGEIVLKGKQREANVKVSMRHICDVQKNDVFVIVI